jgi:hypothetical protein
MKRSFFETAVNEVLACAPRCTTRVFKAFDVSKILFETDISERIADCSEKNHSKQRVQNCVSARLVTPAAHQAMWPKSHNFIELTFSNSPELDENITQLYLKGNSFRDIEKLLSISKTKIRDILIRLKIPIRPAFPESHRATQRLVGKKNVKPPYGFAYLEGRVVKHPKEYPTLLQIIGLWKSGQLYLFNHNS